MWTFWKINCSTRDYMYRYECEQMCMAFVKKKNTLAWAFVKIGFGISRRLKSITCYRETNRLSHVLMERRHILYSVICMFSTCRLWRLYHIHKICHPINSGLQYKFRITSYVWSESCNIDVLCCCV